MTLEFAEELKAFSQKDNSVVGLGNKDITPDALGPHVSEQILAGHLREELSDEDEFLTGLRQSVLQGFWGRRN